MRIPIERLKPDQVFDIPGVARLDRDRRARLGLELAEAQRDPHRSEDQQDRRDHRRRQEALLGPGGRLREPLGAQLRRPERVARRSEDRHRSTATLPLTIGNSEGGLAAGAGSIWMMTDAKGTLARIDPATNKVVAEIYVAPGSFAVAFGEGAVWVTSTEKNLVTRVNPHTNVVEETIPVGPKPRFLAVGEGSVWTINQGDGTISRVDAKTNKVVATIEAGIPGPGGEIAVGEGSVWVTSFEYPITRIDPSTNKVAQQFFGQGGDAIRVGHGSVWLSNLRQSNVWRLDPKRIEATIVP